MLPFFDPLGLINPTTITFKGILQKSWKLNLDWDLPLPLELMAEIKTFLKDLDISTLQFVRNVADNTCHLHLFSDASNFAYGTVAYIVDPNTHTSHLLTSKARLVPIKSKLTIPKLELAALTLSSRLATRLIKLHSFETVTLWSDSTVAIAWAKNPFKSKEVFVANRSHEINSTALPIRYVPTSDNPADLISRSSKLGELHKQLWFFWSFMAYFPFRFSN